MKSYEDSLAKLRSIKSRLAKVDALIGRLCLVWAGGGRDRRHWRKICGHSRRTTRV